VHINVCLGGKCLSNKDANEIVSIQNLSKNFWNFKALDNVSFGIKKGEIFGYIGPNGAGKTTTMKILVGLINDFQGTVSVSGYQLPKQKNEVYKLLGYLPQNVAFQEWRTVNQALKTFGKLSGLSDQKIEERIPEVLGLLGLADVRRKKITQLSGGMTQKVGLAQALLHEPALLILDEPLNGLDPLSRNQFKEIILKLSHAGTTVLFSSHILSDVQDVADKIGIINHGKIRQVGTLNELKANLQKKKIVQVLLSDGNEKWREFRSIKNVSGVEQPLARKVLVTLDIGAVEDQVINDLIQLIVKLEIRVRGVGVLEPSLDQIYLDYVKESEN
jgi:ABC-2 type transport system ATP-binding protein